MENILNQIVATKHREVLEMKKTKNVAFFEKQPLYARSCHSLKRNLKETSFGIIGEIKRKSPSAGDIDQTLTIRQKAESYTKAGVQGISCLTDFDYFGGTIQDLTELRGYVNLPILRKEFIVDYIQIFEAKAAGADAILLICEVLTKKQIDYFTHLAHELDMEVLLELHEEKELEKTFGKADIIGVNNRNLKEQKTSIQTSIDLFKHLPIGKLKITESGLKTTEEITLLANIGYKGALIGESILKNNEPEMFIQNLLSHV